jgi:hypothetical protein
MDIHVMDLNRPSVILAHFALVAASLDVQQERSVKISKHRTKLLDVTIALPAVIKLRVVKHRALNVNQDCTLTKCNRFNARTVNLAPNQVITVPREQHLQQNSRAPLVPFQMHPKQVHV